MKLVHAADLHVDSPLRGLGRYDGAPVDRIRGATRRALVALVDLCLAESADALLLAGDVFDGDWEDYSTGLFFAAQMSRLREAAIPVYSLRGNHDARSKITRRLRLPENVVELSVDAAETRVDERLGLAVHGQGFATRDVTDDLSRAYPAPIAGLFNVGLLHTSLDGRPGHDTYAPCTLAGLVDKGYDYWALGHVHAREVVHVAPYVVYPGNLQGRHAREVGPKGATLVTVASGAVQAVDHVPLDSVRWASLAVDVARARTTDDVVDAARAALVGAADEADGRLLAARVELVGETPCHAAIERAREAVEADVRASANDLLGAAWVERVVFRTAPEGSRDDARRRDDAVGRLVRGIDELRGDEAALAALVAEAGLPDLDAKLRDVTRGAATLGLDAPEDLRALLDEAEALLLARAASSDRPGGEP